MRLATDMHSRDSSGSSFRVETLNVPIQTIQKKNNGCLAFVRLGKSAACFGCTHDSISPIHQCLLLEHSYVPGLATEPPWFRQHYWCFVSSYWHPLLKFSRWKKMRVAVDCHYWCWSLRLWHYCLFETPSQRAVHQAMKKVRHRCPGRYYQLVQHRRNQTWEVPFHPRKNQPMRRSPP